MPVDWSHVVVGGLTAVIAILGRTIYEFTKRRNGDRGNNGERITMHDLLEELHKVRGISQSNAAQLGVLKNDVEWIKRSMRINGGAHE